MSSTCSKSASAASTPYPWGFSELEIDQDLAEQSKFAVRNAAGVMPDGTPFDIPADSPMPDAIDVPEAAAGQIVWLIDADRRAEHARGRRRPDRQREPLCPRLRRPSSIPPPRCASRKKSTSPIRGWRSNCARPASPATSASASRAFSKCATRTCLFDDKYVPPVLSAHAHPVVEGWLDRVIGWIENKLEELARYAADPTVGWRTAERRVSGAAILNRHIAVLMHFRQLRLRPSRAAVRGIAEAGRRACDVRDAGAAGAQLSAYDHDDLENVFGPVMRDLQDFLSARLGRRAIRLEIIERAPNAFSSPIRDRSLFRNATLVLEVAARRPLVGNPERFPASVQGRARTPR